jgi:glycosyltransferase involved in cell wall biosynthesis
MPLKIALVVKELNIRGGTHKQVHRLADYLQRKGHSVSIHTTLFDPGRCYPGIEALRVVAITKSKTASAPRSGRGGAFLERIAWLLRGWRLFSSIPHDVDVINVHDGGCELLMLFALLLRPRTQLIWQINDLPPSCHVSHFSGTPDRFRHKIARVLFRFVARKCNRITVNVAKNSKRVRQCFDVVAEVIHCGVDLRNTIPPTRVHPIPPLELVSTGVFAPYRNYETIIEVQKVLKERHGVESRLRIIGDTAHDPHYAKKIAALISRTGVNATVLGEITEVDLDRVYREASYFFFLNIDQSWGLAVFEAMNYGIPSIVSESVGATELLCNDIDAIIVDPKNATAIADRLITLQRSSADYFSLADRAFASTLKMSWDATYCSSVESRMLQISQR